MATFRFRLATLLRLREAERDERRSHLADAQRAEDIVTARISSLDEELGEMRSHSGEASQPGTVNVDALMEVQRYELLLRAERRATEEQAALVAGEVQRRRESLVTADREVRVLEKLRETQHERHRHDEERSERKELDEVATQVFARRRNNS